MFSNFQKHLSGTVNKCVARLHLYSVEQQTLAEFVARIRELVRDSEYKKESVEENIVYNVIKGVKDNSLRTKLINLGNDLEAIQLCLQHEATYPNAGSFGADGSVNFAKRTQKNACSRCNRKHDRGSCPRLHAAMQGMQSHWPLRQLSDV